jgi:hypothetical protein
MGGASSKTSTEIVNEAINEGLVSHIQKTASSGSGSQSLNIKGSRNVKVCNVDMYQSLELKAANEMDNETVSKMASDVQTKLEQAATAESNLFGIAPADSESNVKVSNKMKNSFKLETVQECMADLKLDQSINIESSEGINVCGVKFYQAANSINQCMNKNKSYQEAKNEAIQDIKNIADAKNASLLGSLLGSCPSFGLPPGVGCSGICCCVIIVAGLGLYFIPPMLEGDD